MTPVIKALFSGFNLDESDPGEDGGEVYIAVISEKSDPDWDSIREALAELTEEMGLTPTEGVDDGFDGRLHALCAHFGDQDDELVGEINGFEDSAWVGDVFRIAQKLNDGHGLKAVKFEGAWHCSKPRLFEFGGNGLFLSNECHLDISSSTALTVGVALQAALDGNDIDKATDLVFTQAKLLLNGIRDEIKSKAVAQKLAGMVVRLAEEEQQ